MSHPVVVIGASGFVGQTLMSCLQREGVPVTGVTRRLQHGLTSVADYADMPMPEGAVLVHLAQARDVSGLSDDGDIELCRALSNRPWRHIVYASSMIVYGDENDYPRQPDELISASSDYTRVKLECERIVINVGGTCLRFSNLYGLGMGKNTVIYDILRQIPGSGSLVLRDISPVRDFLWIEDAARCLVLACRIMPGGILNAGSGIGMSVGVVAQLALKLAGESLRPVVGGSSSGRASCITLDIIKTRSLLNWSPKVDMHTGLSALLGMRVNDE
jgi:nucleoside-diphosphate-sugar epimerase